MLRLLAGLVVYGIATWPALFPVAVRISPLGPEPSEAAGGGGRAQQVNASFPAGSPLSPRLSTPTLWCCVLWRYFPHRLFDLRLASGPQESGLLTLDSPATAVSATALNPFLPATLFGLSQPAQPVMTEAIHHTAS